MLNPDFLSTLKRAVDDNGGFDNLAERLQVTSLELQDWCEGRSAVPAQILIRLADIVIEDSRAARTTAQMPRAA